MEVPHPSIDLPQTLFIIIDGPVEEEWYTPLWRFITNEELSADKLEARRIKRLTPMYSIRDNDIYKQGFLQSWLKCVAKKSKPKRC
jgi:hypothetical protein